MSDLVHTEFITLAQTDEWALVQPMEEQTSLNNCRLFLTWIAEHDMPDDCSEACRSLATKPPEWTGIYLLFNPQPQPGFVLMFKPGWAPTTALEHQNLLAKVLWEIARLKY